MRNTRNNPLEDLGMHLPLICDRYEVRDDVPPGAGKFRGGAGVVKSQRYLTPGFMTHESDRNEDRALGHLRRQTGPLQQGRVAEAARPARSSTSPPSSRACAPRSATSSPIIRRSAAAMAIRWNATRRRCSTTFSTASSRQRMRVTTMAWCCAKSTTATAGRWMPRPPPNSARGWRSRGKLKRRCQDVSEGRVLVA